MAVLKLKKTNERQEIEFELDYLTSLTTRQRFQMMLQKSREMALLLKRNGRRRSTQVVKRT
jgi:GGDEF domain-containing protein